MRLKAIGNAICFSVIKTGTKDRGRAFGFEWPCFARRIAAACRPEAIGGDAI